MVVVDKARLEAGAEAPARVSPNCDTGTFVLLMWGRLTLESAIAAGRLTAKGDQGLINDFDRWLEGH